MKNAKFFWLVGCFFITWVATTSAQPSSPKLHLTSVHLKNGTILVGQAKVLPNDSMTVEIYGGSIFKIATADVQAIQPYDGNFRKRTVQIGSESSPKTKTWYNATNLALMFGYSSSSYFESGVFVQNTTGYQWNRWLGTGVGIGVSNFSLEDAKQVMPVFAEVRGYLMDSPASLFYALQMGYSFGLDKSNNTNLTDAKGGFYIHPSLGIKFASRSNVAFTFSLGMPMQNASFTYFEPWWGGGGNTYTDTYSLRRLAFQFGFLF